MNTRDTARRLRGWTQCALAWSLLSGGYAAAATLPPGFAESLMASGLANPTAMQFAPDGRLFVCEQTGQLRVIKNEALLPTPFVTVPVNASGERGLLGVAFDPAFSTNRHVFVYYTATTPTIHNRVSRFTANGDVALAGSEVVILELETLSATNHNGGAIHFGQDGKLYVAVGDNANGANSQTLGNRLGKILRINPDGTIPSDNPFYVTATGVNRVIWALGLRNPFTFSVQPFSGRMFINDVGETTWEEINDGLSGANYGWPDTEGYTTDPRFNSPLYAYNHSIGCAVTGGAFYDPLTGQFPAEYAGAYFFADFCGGWIRWREPISGSVAGFATGISSPVDLKVWDDGSLYYLARGSGSTTGVVYRIQYGSAAPNITAHPGDRTSAVGGSATFTVSASGTPPITYQWQRNSVNIPGAVDPSYTLSPVQQSDDGALFRAVVTNNFGTATSTAARLTVSTNTPPSGTITQPAAGATYAGGDSITYGGAATDAEDGALPASAFTWWVDFHHDTHTHPVIQPTSGAAGGSFVVPTTGETSDNVWYRISLTVRDSGGLTHTSFRDVRPRTSRITVATSPSGLQITLDGQPRTAPISLTGVVALRRNLSAVSPQALNGTTWEFVSWSDGGAATHDISTPAVDRTYTAVFRAAQGSVALTPEADAYVRNGPYGSRNFGSVTELVVKQISTPEYERESYLKFNLMQVPPIGKAVLRLIGRLSDTRDGGSVVTGVHPVGTQSWTELGITWNTKPPAEASPVASFGVSDTAKQMYEVDLTKFIRAEKAAGRMIVTLALKNPVPSLAYAGFGSKESGPDGPSLVITPPVTFTPVADTYVRAGAYEGTNFGTGPTLIAKKHSDPNYVRESFLRFDLTTAPSFERAVLRLTGALSDAREPTVATNVHAVPNAVWGETSTTWNNRPSAAPSPIATFTVSGTTKRVYEIDVTAFLQSEKAAGRHVVTFVLRNPGASLPYAGFSSRESGADGPALVITP